MFIFSHIIYGEYKNLYVFVYNYYYAQLFCIITYLM